MRYGNESFPLFSRCLLNLEFPKPSPLRGMRLALGIARPIRGIMGIPYAHA